MRERVSTTKLSACFVTMILCIWVFALGANSVLGESDEKIFWLSNTFSPFILLAGISLFLLFERIEISSRVINYVAKSTFAVYLVHDNPLVRDIVWKQILHTELFLENPLLMLAHLILSTICIFLFSIILETGRNYIERKLLCLDVIKKLNIKAEGIFK